MKNINDLRIKIFSDGADKENMLEMAKKPFVQGLTTNPTLMRKAGVRDYEEFCRSVLDEIKEKPISFEVFSDDFSEMERQARKIASWGRNVYVKIPISNTKGIPSYDLIKRLSSDGISLNVTAIFTLQQVEAVVNVIEDSVPNFVSVFAGRIADTGIDPLPIMKSALSILKSNSSSELIWASPRELLNIIQGDEIGCHIITVTSDILRKLEYLGYPLDDFSLDTVKMFFDDAQNAGFAL